MGSVAGARTADISAHADLHGRRVYIKSVSLSILSSMARELPEKPDGVLRETV